MPSFASLLTYAALGFAAFASVAAVPVTVADNHLSLVEVEARGCDCKSLPTIIVDLTADLNACFAPIVFGTSANITLDVVTPIIVEAKALVVAAIVDVKVLVGLNVEVILATATGVISLIDISGLLCTLLALIFSVVNIVLTILVKVDVDIISPLLCELLVVVAELLQLVLSLVGGLLAILLPLIFNIILPVILKLNLVSVFAFLGVSIQL